MNTSIRKRSLWTSAAVGTALLVPTALPAAGASSSAGELLDRPAHGSSALSSLGDDLATAAALNHLSATELRNLLRTDSTMWLDTTGRLFVKDPVVPEGRRTARDTRPGPFPNGQTFLLHSRPGAQKVLYLDFDGGALSGTAWNDQFGVSTNLHAGLDLDGSPGSWSQQEVDLVQGVYQRVAEDYAPFDIDVTTEDPGPAALARDSAGDNRFGTRVMISPSAELAQNTCASNCGGIAYIGVFNLANNGYHQPALVFPQLLGQDEKNIAEAASHEAGHNLGLLHDGTSSEGYYGGHGNWAPIMGVGYFQPLAQWSAGEYPDANNQQDDLAVIQSLGLPLRADDHADGISGATPVGSGTSASGVVGARADRDVFAFTRTAACATGTTITAAPAPVSPNLDIQLRLLDGSGAVIAQDDAESGRITTDLASGLDASVTAALSPGTYYVELDGRGARDLTTGYSDYGSLGQYAVSVPPDACTPSRTTIRHAKNGHRGGAVTATTRWRAPQSDGGSALTGYVVRALRIGAHGHVVGHRDVVASASAHKARVHLQRGSYRFKVKAVNAVGNGHFSTRSNKVHAR